MAHEVYGSSRWLADDGLSELIPLISNARGELESVRVEHEVKLDDFTKWVNRTGGAPRATCR